MKNEIVRTNKIEKNQSIKLTAREVFVRGATQPMPIQSK